MKIAFDNQTFCLQSYGGISRYIFRVAESLNGLDQDAKIFAGLHQNNYLPSLPTKQVIGKRIGYPRRGSGRITTANTRICNQLIKLWQPDIIHKTYYFNPASTNKPVVITVHDMIHELFSADFHPNDKTTQYKMQSINDAKCVIAISQSTKNDLINLFGINEEKVHVIYHGVDDFKKSDNLNPNKTITNRPYLLYVGQRNGYKNFNNLLLSYANSKLDSDFDLIAFGGGDWSHEEKKFIHKLKLAKNVHQITGDDSLLGALYSQAVAFVYPSKYEGFGIPPLEAMAHNCPVISSNASSMPEVIADAGVFFNPNDIDDMATALKAVLYDEDIQKKLVVKGGERLKFFSWEKCAKQTLDVYKSLL